MGPSAAAFTSSLFARVIATAMMAVTVKMVMTLSSSAPFRTLFEVR
jgi:hypothetical protein